MFPKQRGIPALNEGFLNYESTCCGTHIFMSHDMTWGVSLLFPHLWHVTTEECPPTEQMGAQIPYANKPFVH